jgi:hypothetical protein
MPRKLCSRRGLMNANERGKYNKNRLKECLQNSLKYNLFLRGLLVNGWKYLLMLLFRMRF